MLRLLLDNYIGISMVLIGIAVWVAITFFVRHPSKGEIGENRVSSLLSKVQGGIVLNDLLFATETGYSQIDHILLTTHGIFIVETKNYGGALYGNDDDKHWTHFYRNGKRGEPMYNPVWQNKTHAKVVRALLERQGLNTKCLIPITVFMSGVTLRVDTKQHVVYDHQLLNTIAMYTKELLTPETVQQVALFLAANNITDAAARRAHIEHCQQLRRYA